MASAADPACCDAGVYEAWRRNVPFTYDWLCSTFLEWGSLSADFLGVRPLSMAASLRLKAGGDPAKLAATSALVGKAGVAEADLVAKGAYMRGFVFATRTGETHSLRSGEARGAGGSEGPASGPTHRQTLLQAAQRRLQPSAAHGAPTQPAQTLTRQSATCTQAPWPLPAPPWARLPRQRPRRRLHRSEPPRTLSAPHARRCGVRRLPRRVGGHPLLAHGGRRSGAAAQHQPAAQSQAHRARHRLLARPAAAAHRSPGRGQQGPVSGMARAGSPSAPGPQRRACARTRPEPATSASHRPHAHTPAPAPPLHPL